MKEQVSQKSAVTGLLGCEWWTGSATFQPDLWSGGLEKSADGAQEGARTARKHAEGGLKIEMLRFKEDFSNGRNEHASRLAVTVP